VFRISDIEYLGAVIVLPERTLPWPVDSIASVAPDDFTSLLILPRPADLLLLGCGAAMQLLPAAARAALKQAGVIVEPMDTGAACRTFNVLMGEDRRVAAALLPMP
jgi:uncharacterized protein